jgi:hypothetical protein
VERAVGLTLGSRLLEYWGEKKKKKKSLPENNTTGIRLVAGVEVDEEKAWVASPKLSRMEMWLGGSKGAVNLANSLAPRRTKVRGIRLATGLPKQHIKTTRERKKKKE